ncbi:DUF2304 domain-containing protein [Actinocrispum wychmicini]|uniref:DUF2304 domain-containing protein n=1 Tax=Actinocrispum wychmicini TaxID=1213861 RepID=A0A4R2KD97_9PSEU|nr:DUF2304 domain-containing protein [Actinocrispum wychmicini]TCO64485.1 hypothetical protein EV192_101261 [Actinocrispum wychmicini]
MAAWRVLSIVVAVLVLLIVVEMMRRRKLREKYAGIWLLLAIGVAVLGAVPGVAEWLSSLMHFITVSNFVLFLALGVLGMVALHLSAEVGHLEEEVRTSVEETALVRCELEETKQELEKRIQLLESRSEMTNA